MWAMYGKASGIKLRLDFDTKLFVNNLDSFYYDSGKKNKLAIFRVNNLLGPGYTNEPVKFSDVAYLDKKSMEIKHNTRPFPETLLVDDNLIEKLTGFIKYDAWEFEKETRLVVQLRDDRNTIDKKLPERIYCGITDDLIKSFKVTFNPWMSPLLKEEIEKSLENIAGFKIDCIDSNDDGETTEL